MLFAGESYTMERSKRLDGQKRMKQFGGVHWSRALMLLLQWVPMCRWVGLP